MTTTTKRRPQRILEICWRTKYWNREESTVGEFPSHGPITKEARILSLSNANDPANAPLHKAPLHRGELAEGAKLLAIGTKLEEFDIEALKQQEPNVLFVSHPQVRDILTCNGFCEWNKLCLDLSKISQQYVSISLIIVSLLALISKKARKPLVHILEALPSIEWVHTRSAGIDSVASDGLAKAENIYMTNATKGQFCSTLAEYTMMACAYFAKDLPRLLRQTKANNWGLWK